MNLKKNLWSPLVIMLISITVASSAEITTIAGKGMDEFSGDGGPALKAGLGQPFGLEIGPDGMLYFCEFSNHVVRRLDFKTGSVMTVAGTGRKAGYVGDAGPATAAQLHEPHEIRFDAEGNFYLSDTASHAIRKVDVKSGIISTVAGIGERGFSGDSGLANHAKLNLPIAVSLDPKSGLLICDIGNHRIRRVELSTGQITTFAGTGERKPIVEGQSLMGASLNGPRSIAVAPNGDLFIVLREGNAIYRIDRATSTLHHLAGTGEQGYTGDGGDARQARLAGPKGIAIDHSGNVLLCDTENHSVRIVSKATGKIETLVGNGTAGDGPDGDTRHCRLNRPHGIYVDQQGNLYIGDSSNHKVRKVTF